MSRILGIILFFSIQLTGYCQTRQDSIHNAFAFVDTVLIAGPHHYDIVDFEYPQEIQDLMLKMKNAIESNMDWYLSYAKKNYVPGEGLPYDTLLGISKEQFDRLKHMDTIQTILKVLGGGEVEIVKESKTITFKSKGATKLLNYLKIDPGQSLMKLDSDTLSFDHFMKITNNTRMGPWKGYLWTKHEITNTLSTEKLNETNAKMIDLILGRLNTGQRFIRIKYQQLKNGESLANSDILMFLK